MTDTEPTDEDLANDPGFQFFTQLKDQEADTYVAGAAWAGNEVDKRQLLDEIGSMAVTFIMARLARFAEQGGDPKQFVLSIGVQVDGPRQAKLEVPKQELIIP